VSLTETATLWEDDEDNVQKKQCVYCKKYKPITDFTKHIAMYDNLDTRCRQCVSERGKRLRRLRKFAPPKPENCECCGISIHDDYMKGRRYSGLVLDHDDVNDRVRGWICESCNRGIGALGDTSTGLKLALAYLIRAENKVIL
jgi:hypothetical protein